jgi:hypothetical protein
VDWPWPREHRLTVTDHQAAFVQKIFVINFITSYLGIFLTAFVYVPFAKVLVPYLDVFQLTAQRFTAEGKALPTKSWQVNPNRLTKQVIYFTVTAQIVNFATEAIVPHVKRKLFKTVEKVQSELSEKNDTTTAAAAAGTQQPQDQPDEAEFLRRVRNEAELDVYDVTIDYREMVIQFGYLSLFSVVWPLTACSFLVNNWVEARSDAVKIATNCQRPIPWRADSIGPWLNALGFLAWLGSVTSAALVFLFHATGNGNEGSPWDIRGWALLLSILFAEHLYLVVQFVVRGVVKKLDSPGLQKEKRERFVMRKQLLERMIEGDVGAEVAGGPGVSGGEAITREVLEEEARRLSVAGEGSPEQLFWQRQRGAGETIHVGRALISGGLSTGKGEKSG